MRTMRGPVFSLLLCPLMVYAVSVNADDNIQAICEPPAGEKSPFAGVEYQYEHVAANCVSAYPRVDDWQRQGSWESAVQKRCNSIYRLRLTGNQHKPDYREACILAERDFRERSGRWVDRKVIDRVERPVCASTFDEGPNGEKLYACSVYFSTDKDSGPARELSEDAIIIDN